MTSPAEKEDSPLSLMVGGVFMMALGIGMLYFLNQWEAEGGRMRMNAIIALVYAILGKWGVFALCDLVGLAIFIKGALRAGKQ